MGLDIACGDLTLKVGSYENVEKIHYLLLVALKDYLEFETEDYDQKVDYLCEIIKKENCIQYDKISNRKNFLFWRDELDGFFPFIFDSELSTTMSDYEAKRFLQTFDIVKDHVHQSLKFVNEFYLSSVFQESIDSGNEITFF